MNPLLKFNINNTEYKPNVFYSSELGYFVAKDLNGKVCVLDKGGDKIYYRTSILDASVIRNDRFVWDSGTSGHIEFTINVSGYICGSITFKWGSEHQEGTAIYRFNPSNAPEFTYDSITSNSPTIVYKTETFNVLGIPSEFVQSYMLYQYELWGGVN